MDATMSKTTMFNTAIICCLLLQLSILSIICSWIMMCKWHTSTTPLNLSFIQYILRFCANMLENRQSDSFRKINWILWIILLDIGCILCYQFFNDFHVSSCNKKYGFCWMALQFWCFLQFPSFDFFFCFFFLLFLYSLIKRNFALPVHKSYAM